MINLQSKFVGLSICWQKEVMQFGIMVDMLCDRGRWNLTLNIGLYRLWFSLDLYFGKIKYKLGGE